MLKPLGHILFRLGKLQVDVDQASDVMQLSKNLRSLGKKWLVAQMSNETRWRSNGKAGLEWRVS
jgi:hypothetical protein